MKSYENRYVAFLDILGFKKTVQKEKFDYINDIIKIFENLRKENYNKKRMGKVSIGAEISLFSDSLIISYPEKDNVTKNDNLFYLVDDINMLQCDLAFKEVLLRGVITKGELYHKKSICFGEALLEAIKLEESAVYPRIILSEKILNDAITNNLEKDKKYSQYNTFESEAVDFYKILKKDIDGFWYTDFMSQLANFDESDYYIEMLLIMKKKCDNVIHSECDEHIKMKYEWLNDKLNKTVKEMNLDIPQCHSIFVN